VRWRITLALSIVASLLAYKWLPIESSLARFLVSGLCLSIVSRSIVIAWYRVSDRRRLTKSVKVQEEREALKAAAPVHSTVNEQLKVRH
jgi:hypothetical protein